MSETQTIDVRARKVREIVKLAVRNARAARVYFEMLRNLNKSVSKETRSITAKYASVLKKALGGGQYDPVELANLLLEMKREWRSWRVENAEELRILKEVATEYYKSLRELMILTESENESE